MNPKDVPLPFGGNPQPGLYTAGQPTADDFAALAKAGVKHVIDLRPESEEHGFDEADVTAKLGLKRTVIPVAGPAEFSTENARKLDAALAATNGEPVIVHCASANRVGALLALRAHRLQGKSEEEALAFGRAGGLTRLEPQVAQLLQEKE